MIDPALVERLPKAELHCHLDGSLRPETLLDLGRASGARLPATDAVGIRRAMRVSNGCTLERYLSCFSVTIGVLQTAEALERAAYELAEEVARETVWYLEVRLAPVLHTRGGLDQSDVLNAVHRGLTRAEREHDVRPRIIVCALRNLGADASLETARLAVAHRDRGVVGLDLAGAEAGHPAASHASAFLYAREHDLACTCHAGEADGAGSVRQAIHRCGADRIGHGTRMIEDTALTDYAADHSIPLELCLTSNVQTSAVPSYDAHPLRRFLERGVPVVLCTDNRLMSDTTLTAEYQHAIRSQGLTLDELCAIARRGFASAFIPWSDRLAMLRRFDAVVTDLRRLDAAR